MLSACSCRESATVEYQIWSRGQNRSHYLSDPELKLYLDAIPEERL